LLVTAPLLAIVLVMLGFSTNIARFLGTMFSSLAGGEVVANTATT